MSALELSLTVPGRVRVTAAADRGQVVAVIGPNGAGKSSLLRAVAGLVPSTGEIRVDGRSWTTLAVRERAVGMAFQDQLLFPHLSALENVAFGPRTAGVPRADARRTAQGWLDRFGVAAGLRVELARHLTSYDGVTLLVTHDAIDALTLADVVWVLDEGELVQVGPPREVAARPLTRHVARLVGLNVIADGDGFRSFSPSAVTVSLTEPSGSARHRWPGAVTTLAPHGDAVRLLVSGEHELLADVTPAAVAELGLGPGSPVQLTVKATEVTIYASSRATVSADR